MNQELIAKQESLAPLKIGDVPNIKIIPFEPDSNSDWRIQQEKLFHGLLVSISVLVVLFLVAILWQTFAVGAQWLDWQFLTSFPSRFAAKAGVYPALLGTIWLVGGGLAVAIPLSVLSSIYLEELMAPSKFKNFIDTNLANLAGVPSIVYGILGLAVFVRYLDFGRSVLAGSLTLALLAMPIIVIACREALAAVPHSIKQAALALGASPMQTAFHHTLPMALPGILSGVILAISRIIGETAPLLIVGAAGYISFAPESPFDEFSALPVQIYNWAARPQEEFHHLAAAGIVVLLGVVFSFNIIAIIIRNRSLNRKRS